MKAPWPYERCVLCLVEPDPADEQTWLTDAHIIPESVGGGLSVRFLCRRCNSTLGHEVEGPLLADDGIRHCIEVLETQLPVELLNRMRKRKTWFANSTLGPVTAAMTEAGELQPLESATFKREEHARAEVEAEWRRHGLDDAEIAEYLEIFDSAPGNELLHLPGFTVQPRVDLDGLEFRLPWTGPPVPATLPLAIAFLYLCLYDGEACYEAHELDPIRTALKNNDESKSQHWEVEHLRHEAGCSTFHRLAIKEIKPVVVHVQLFQHRVWWVKFPKIGLKKEPPGHYGIDVASRAHFRW